MRVREFNREFEELLANPDAAGRGRAFERLLATRLESEGFTVYSNPKGAKPRQTDLIASLGSQVLLIEAKWRQRKIDISDIDNLRARLNRTPSDIVGCIFNMSDFTTEAVKAAESDRTREILLFNAGEINSIFRGLSIQELLQNKRTELRIHGKVLFVNPAAASHTLTSFTPPNLEFRIAEKSVTCVSAASHRDDTAFLLDIPDIGEYQTSGVLELRLGLQSVSDLADAFDLLRRTMKLSGDGCFSIHQLNHCWHGVGLPAFLESINDWKKRYSAAKLQSPHHSEELAYFELSGGALIAVTSRQRIGDSVFLHGSELEIQLAGIPVDSSGLLELCRETNNEQLLFQTRTEKRLHTANLRLERVKLTPVAKIVSNNRGNEWICGIVAKNPFTPRRLQKVASRLDDFLLRALRNTEYLICDMMDHYSSRDDVTQPYISDIYGVWSGHMPLINVRCTWDNYVRRAEELPRDLGAVLAELPDYIGER